MAERLYNNKLTVSPSKMTFNDYYMKFIGKNEANLANGWGWFVDIELNSEPVREIQNRSNKYGLFTSLPTKTNPGIQSKKSVRNLQDISMMFEMDQDNKEGKNDHNKNSKTDNYNYNQLFTNCMGVLAVAICYYISYH
jgi:hypothetical protein